LGLCFETVGSALCICFQCWKENLDVLSTQTYLMVESKHRHFANMGLWNCTNFNTFLGWLMGFSFPFCKWRGFTNGTGFVLSFVLFLITLKDT